MSPHHSLLLLGTPVSEDTGNDEFQSCQPGDFVRRSWDFSEAVKIFLDFVFSEAAKIPVFSNEFR